MPYRPPQDRGVTPGNRGRFPGFDVLDEVHRWDDVTSGAVLARLNSQRQLSFFTPAEQAIAGCLFDQLLGQREDPKIPVLAMVDERLALDETDGWYYEDMPEDAQAWRITLDALDQDARSNFAAGFAGLEWDQQAKLIQDVKDAEEWHGLKAKNVWSLWTRYACTAFYSHPWAWNEIGFGGPAYPRGYKALGVDKRERWEVGELDAEDPVSWSHRVEQARRVHEAATEKSDQRS